MGEATAEECINKTQAKNESSRAHCSNLDNFQSEMVELNRVAILPTEEQ